MSNQENNSNNSRLTYPQIDSYYNKVMKITEFPEGSLGHKIYDKEINEAEDRMPQNAQSNYIDDGLASAKKKKYIVLRLLNKEEFDKIYKDIKEKFDNKTFQNTIDHLTESKKLPKTNDKGDKDEKMSKAMERIKSIPDKLKDQYLEKLKEMVNNIDEQLDEVSQLSDDELSEKQNFKTNGLYKYKELFNNSGGKRTRRRRKSRKARKSRKSRKARKSRR